MPDSIESRMLRVEAQQARSDEQILAMRDTVRMLASLPTQVATAHVIQESIVEDLRELTRQIRLLGETTAAQIQELNKSIEEREARDRRDRATLQRSVVAIIVAIIGGVATILATGLPH